MFATLAQSPATAIRAQRRQVAASGTSSAIALVAAIRRDRGRTASAIARDLAPPSGIARTSGRWIGRGRSSPSRHRSVALGSGNASCLEIVLLEPEAVPAAAEVIAAEQIESPEGGWLFSRCCQLSRDGGISPISIDYCWSLTSAIIKNLLVDLDEQGRAKSLDDAGNIEAVGGALGSAARFADDAPTAWPATPRRRRASPAVEQINRSGPRKNWPCLNQLIEQERTRQGISSPTEG